MAIHLSGLPGGGTPEGAPDGPSVPLFDLAPGGVCRADRITPIAGALLPHRFTLTCALPGGIAIGGLFSVALSCRSPRLAVSQHPALWSPDLPRPVPVRGSPRPTPAAATRPAHRHHHRPTGHDGPRSRTPRPSVWSPQAATGGHRRPPRWVTVTGVLTWRRVPRVPGPPASAGRPHRTTTRFPSPTSTAASTAPSGRPSPRGLDHRRDPLDQGSPQGPLLHRPGRPEARPRHRFARPQGRLLVEPLASGALDPRPAGHHPRHRPCRQGPGRGAALQAPRRHQLQTLRARYRFAARQGGRRAGPAHPGPGRRRPLRPQPWLPRSPPSRSGSGWSPAPAPRATATSSVASKNLAWPSRWQSPSPGCRVVRPPPRFRRGSPGSRARTATSSSSSAVAGRKPTWPPSTPSGWPGRSPCPPRRCGPASATPVTSRWPTRWPPARSSLPPSAVRSSLDWPVDVLAIGPGGRAVVAPPGWPGSELATRRARPRPGPPAGRGDRGALPARPPRRAPRSSGRHPARIRPEASSTPTASAISPGPAQAGRNWPSPRRALDPRRPSRPDRPAGLATMPEPNGWPRRRVDPSGDACSGPTTTSASSSAATR